MILYDLTCDKDHEFESWFKNSSAYEALRKARKVSCPVCGSAKVRKAPMAPNIAKSGRSDRAISLSSETSGGHGGGKGESKDIAAAMHKAAEALSELRETIERNFENVGDQFPEEARKIHYGEADERPIYGDATLKDAKDLIEEGIDVVTLPLPKRRTS